MSDPAQWPKNLSAGQLGNWPLPAELPEQQGSGTRTRTNFPFTPETPKKGTYNELLRLIKTNFDRGIMLRGFAPMQASTTFGQVFMFWENGEYLAYLITDIDSSAAFSTG